MPFRTGACGGTSSQPHLILVHDTSSLLHGCACSRSKTVSTDTASLLRGCAHALGQLEDVLTRAEDVFEDLRVNFYRAGLVLTKWRLASNAISETENDSFQSSRLNAEFVECFFFTLNNTQNFYLIAVAHKSNRVMETLSLSWERTERPREHKGCRKLDFYWDSESWDLQIVPNCSYSLLSVFFFNFFFTETPVTNKPFPLHSLTSQLSSERHLFIPAQSDSSSDEWIITYVIFSLYFVTTIIYLLNKDKI